MSRSTLWLCLSLLAGSSFAAPPSPAPSERPRLTVLNLSASAGVDPEIAKSFSEAVALEAGQIGTFEVHTQADISTLLGLERSKQLLGCGDEAASCALELAEALGSRFVLSGSLVKLGNTWQLNLQMLDAKRGTPVGRTTRLASDLETIRAQLPWALAEATGTPAPRSPSRVLPYALIIGGGVAMLASGVLLLQSFVAEQNALAELQVMGATLNNTAAYYRAQDQQVSQLRLIAGLSAGLGAALLVTGILINPRADAVTRVALVPTFGGFAVVGGFP